jgi:hypothetical protein
MNAAGLRHGDWRSTKVLPEEPAQLPFHDTQAFGQGSQIAPVIERPMLDQGERAVDRIRRASPRANIGRRFRPAAQAGSIARLLSRRRGRIEDHVVSFWRGSRAHWAAIDARRLHSAEEAAIEARVARLDGAVASVLIKIHGTKMGMPDHEVSRISDINDRSDVASAFGSRGVAIDIGRR